jgi:hypothetical protein
MFWGKCLDLEIMLFDSGLNATSSLMLGHKCCVMLNLQCNALLFVYLNAKSYFNLFTQQASIFQNFQPILIG